MQSCNRGGEGLAPHQARKRCHYRAEETPVEAAGAAIPRKAMRSAWRPVRKIVASFAHTTIEIRRDDIADLTEAGGRRDADVFTQVMESFEDPPRRINIRQQAARRSGPPFRVSEVPKSGSS
jgi:hypothetical protein